MLRSSYTKSLAIVIRRRPEALRCSSSTASHHPNAPLDLDPSFQALLKDADMSLLRNNAHKPPHRELEPYPNDPLISDDLLTSEELDIQEGVSDHRETKKSPAALFGSQRIGAVVLPFELRNTITKLISASDKSMLRVDAQRLFLNDEDETEWETSYDVKYKSRHQAARHAERDGTAFASVALPAHYSAIVAILDHVKRRLGPGWKIEHVIDWGAATGSGLWAAAHSFQRKADTGFTSETDDPQLSQTIVTTYRGIDKREGLVTIGKRLLRDVDLGEMKVSWRKSWQEHDEFSRSEGGDVIALSTFILSSLPTPLARKTMVKEMWESGADVMILVDHNSTAGFECIAEAREHLLRMGQREMEDPEFVSDVKGSHVVAPCPHDDACPLYHPGSSKLVCGFNQRLQRPPFVRKTKHSGTGHEDTGYSYVVIRRGARPARVTTKFGRIGEVGQRELDKEALKRIPITELFVDGDHAEQDHEVLAVPLKEEVPALAASEPVELIEADQDAVDEICDSEELATGLRQEAYSWPRLVFPPLKRSGHIILDASQIMRMTIPKSQGKQPYYDARKSGWGDIFPHEPKNTPQVRHQPTRAKRPGGTTATAGEDIGKRGTIRPGKPKASYTKLSDEIKAHKNELRRARAHAKEDLLSD
ncbi:Rsm22-cox11 tandem protein 2, mitochondrial [Grifola frondosa]|uniref:Rsm22-cox11 tandem protein 2, mitochondrial n=1 Tax=Grifola frondosa TaxID=5627 RepID=A0A1C7LUQ5_GRIFR|nr:Rsm22-cox11 tandem protein 2, mitochondrial [Grifola frondosa]